MDRLEAARQDAMHRVRSDPHIGPDQVQEVLSGLADNMLVALPSTCCQAVGLDPNINDKQAPKELWIGRLRHLRRMLSALSLRGATEPHEVRRTFLQAALDGVESRHPEEAEIPIMLAREPSDRLRALAHAAIVIQKYWRGRIQRKWNSLDVLNAFDKCIVRGYVVFLCGSTGIAGDSLRYMRLLAGLGYLVLAPDDLAGASRLRRRAARLILRPQQATDYWQRNLLYADDGAKGELVYTSTTDGVLRNPQHFDAIYNNIITVRQAELAFTLRRLPDHMRRDGVFLFGMSEGAVTLASFNDEPYAHMLRGRIIASYSCEQNYWNYSRPEDAGLQGRAEVPTLNMMGFEDEYFGVRASVAAAVAAVGEHPPISGHAFEAMLDKDIRWGLVVHFEGGRHSLLLTHDAVIRELLRDWLARPGAACTSLPLLWGSLPGLQDEITRVRRAPSGQVLYVRVRPPSQAEAEAGGEDSPQHIPALLAKLASRLYRLDHARSLDKAGSCEVTGADAADVAEAAAATEAAAAAPAVGAAPPAAGCSLSPAAAGRQQRSTAAAHGSPSSADVPEVAQAGMGDCEAAEMRRGQAEARGPSQPTASPLGGCSKAGQGAQQQAAQPASLARAHEHDDSPEVPAACRPQGSPVRRSGEQASRRWQPARSSQSSPPDASASRAQAAASAAKLLAHFSEDGEAFTAMGSRSSSPQAYLLGGVGSLQPDDPSGSADAQLALPAPGRDSTRRSLQPHSCASKLPAGTFPDGAVSATLLHPGQQCFATSPCAQTDLPLADEHRCHWEADSRAGDRRHTSAEHCDVPYGRGNDEDECSQRPSTSAYTAPSGAKPRTAGHGYVRRRSSPPPGRLWRTASVGRHHHSVQRDNLVHFERELQSLSDFVTSEADCEAGTDRRLRQQGRQDMECVRPHGNTELCSAAVAGRRSGAPGVQAAPQRADMLRAPCSRQKASHCAAGDSSLVAAMVAQADATASLAQAVAMTARAGCATAAVSAAVAVGTIVAAAAFLLTQSRK